MSYVGVILTVLVVCFNFPAILEWLKGVYLWRQIKAEYADYLWYRLDTYKHKSQD